MLNLFENKSAWFSDSVEKKKSDLWVRQGGKLADKGTADFLFSEDAKAEDTKRIYLSPAYNDDAVTVFHASYVDACLKVESMKKVALGEYFLPPPGLQDIIRQQITMKWEEKTPTTRNAPTQPSGGGTSQTAQGDSNQRSARTHQDVQASSTSQSTSASTTRSSDFIGTHLCYPIAQKDIPHVDDLPAVQGPLRDFLPGKNGCTVRYKK
ncbi:telomere repeats-binding bouquet formation protein 2-like [Ptychodera flava]|uniref:telomere repeats-binding bouquet formation protein 2-like n=1 Tax=Ptychodera flava TaxID=63121 RepID=UPI00396A4F7C